MKFMYFYMYLSGKAFEVYFYPPKELQWQQFDYL